MAEPFISRRSALKTILASAGSLGAAAFIPSNWIKPIVHSGVLPAHAQSFPGIHLAFGYLDFPGGGNEIEGDRLTMGYRVGVVYRGSLYGEFTGINGVEVAWSYTLLGGTLEDVNATFPLKGTTANVSVPGGSSMDGLALFSPDPVIFNFAEGGFLIRMTITSKGLEIFTEDIHAAAGSFMQASSPLAIP